MRRLEGKVGSGGAEPSLAARAICEGVGPEVVGEEEEEEEEEEGDWEGDEVGRGVSGLPGNLSAMGCFGRLSPVACC